MVVLPSAVEVVGASCVATRSAVCRLEQGSHSNNANFAAAPRPSLWPQRMMRLLLADLEKMSGQHRAARGVTSPAFPAMQRSPERGDHARPAG